MAAAAADAAAVADAFPQRTPYRVVPGSSLLLPFVIGVVAIAAAAAAAAAVGGGVVGGDVYCCGAFQQHVCCCGCCCAADVPR